MFKSFKHTNTKHSEIKAMNKLKEPIVHLFNRCPGQYMTDCVLCVQPVVESLVSKSVIAKGGGK